MIFLKVFESPRVVLVVGKPLYRIAVRADTKRHTIQYQGHGANSVFKAIPVVLRLPTKCSERSHAKSFREIYSCSRRMCVRIPLIQDVKGVNWKKEKFKLHQKIVILSLIL